jgi:exosortase K
MKPAQVERAARWGAVLVALGGAVLLKRFYSQASADELRFILAPTTWLTAAVLQSDFVFHGGEGYLSRELSVLIAPACAGINFAIATFLALVLGFGGHFTTPRRALAWLATAAAVAYLATLVVNAARIVLSVALAHLATRVLGLTFQSVHRLLGIVIYLAGLLALCLTLQVWLPSRSVAGLRRSASLVALACYAGVTLLVPVLGGAATNPGFWSHAATVSVLVVVSAALLFAARGRTWDDGRHAVRSSERSERVAAQLDSL